MLRKAISNVRDTLRNKKVKMQAEEEDSIFSVPVMYFLLASSLMEMESIGMTLFLSYVLHSQDWKTSEVQSTFLPSLTFRVY